MLQEKSVVGKVYKHITIFRHYCCYIQVLLPLEVPAFNTTEYKHGLDTPTVTFTNLL